MRRDDRAAIGRAWTGSILILDEALLLPTNDQHAKNDVCGQKC